MSNVFNNELHLAIKEVYTELENSELIQENLEKAAKIGLYNAHGATEKASNKLDTDQTKSKTTAIDLKEATTATEVCGNIVTAATAAANDARNTNSAASTAAVNIQSAADSLTDLSADVAAILAVATAKDCGSKIQQLANMATNITCSAAKMAENTTLQSLNTTIEAAQSRAAVSLSQAKTLVTDITGLNKTLDDNFDALQTKISDDSKALSGKIAEEHEQGGIYKTALEEEKALQYSECFINKKVNYDLKYIKVGNKGERFDLSFNSFDGERYVLVKGKLKRKWVLSEYRIIFTSVDDAPAFDIHAAKATTSYTSFQPAPPSDPSKPKTHTLKFHTAEYSKPTSGNEYIAVDNTGQAIKRGTPYVAFVYVVFTCPYQNEMENTDGYISLPSLSFNLQTELPAAEKPRLHFYKNKIDKGNSCSVTNAMHVSFIVNDLMYHDLDLCTITDFRVFLFNKNNEMANLLNNFSEGQLVHLYAFDETFREAEQAYIDAQQVYNTAIATQPDSEVDLGDLKGDLNTAKDNYEKATKKYNNQLNTIEIVNEAKISDFFLDNEILKTIPVAFGQNATKIDKQYIENIKTEIDLIERSKEGTKLEISAVLAEYKKKNSDVQTKITSAKKDRAKDEKENERLIKKLEKDLASDEIVKELHRFIDTALKYGEIKYSEILEEFESYLIELEIEKAEDILLDVDKIRNNNLSIDQVNKKIKEYDDIIKSNMGEADEIVSSLEMEMDKRSSQLSFYYSEIEELVSNKNAEPLSKVSSDLDKSRKALTKLKKKAGDNSAEIAELEKKIQGMENKQKELAADIERGAINRTEEQNSDNFTAINLKGDFTDNYGEPLIHGNSYTALVFSVIKSSRPNQIPLFKTNYSTFSDSVVFNLPQL